MRKLLIFVIEGKSKSHNSDGKYVSATLDNYYSYDRNRDIIRYVDMNGKGNYKKKSVIKQINDLIKKALFIDKNTEIHVIYIFDKDQTNYSSADKKLNDDIIQYCTFNKFRIIWMNKNIEDVYWQRRVENKTQAAIDFEKKNQIQNVNIKRLQIKDAISNQSSNILCVLDEILIRKK